MTISKVLILVAVIIFAFAALGLVIGPAGALGMIAAGLAFWAAASLVA